MKFKALFAAAALAASTPAFAADLAPAPVEPAAPIYTAFNWTGFYVGAQVGYGWGKSSGRVSDTAGELAHAGIDPNGFFGGGYAGYNMQFSPELPLVVGIEGDVNASALKGSETDNGFDVHGKQTWNGAVRGRLGYAWDRFLPYVAGGVAFGNYRVNIPGAGSNTNTRVGWTAGVGLEYAFTDNIIGRAEYRYTDYGNDHYNFGGLTTRAGLKTNDVRLGVSYKF